MYSSSTGSNIYFVSISISSPFSYSPYNTYSSPVNLRIWAYMGCFYSLNPMLLNFPKAVAYD